MTDMEKILLCQNIVRDYWDYCSEENQQFGAEVLITALSSVLDFGGTSNE